MSIDKERKKLLMEMTEQILLNEKELESLKLLINDLSIGKIDPKQLKIAIIKSRATALRRITDIFPFFHKRIINQQEINNFASKDNNSELIQELEEKNKFLEEIGERVNNILDKLQGKIE